MTSEAQKVPAPKGVVLSEREATLAEFEDYLRTVDNRDGCPYEERSIEAYVSPGKHLDKWLTSQGIDGDFTATDTAHLNRYFREYFRAHGQGGTHTLQRNLIQLYNFLQRERDHPSPYTDGLNRYAPVKGRPKTLGAVSLMTFWRLPAEAGRGTSRRPVTTPSSASCVARASAGRNCSAWSCTRSRQT
jgi:hypothetical protein